MRNASALLAAAIMGLSPKAEQPAMYRMVEWDSPDDVHGFAKKPTRQRSKHAKSSHKQNRRKALKAKP